MSILSTDVTSNYDVVFLFGDLNFRLNRSREDVLDIVARNWGGTLSAEFKEELPNLLASDQLKHSLKHSNI